MMKEGPIEAHETSRVLTPRTTIPVKRGISLLDLVLRVVAIVGTLGSAVAMGTTNETLPFSTQFSQFQARYDDLPTLTFFVITNSIVCGYLALSLALSIFHVVKSRTRSTRIMLILFDTVMLAFLTAGASAATAIVYLAHKGNASANWLTVCQQFNDFCKRISGSLIGSFVTIIVFIVLIFLSGIALSFH